MTQTEAQRLMSLVRKYAPEQKSFTEEIKQSH